MIGDSQSQGTKDALSRNTSRARAAGRAAPAAGIRFHSRSGRGTKAFLLWLATPAAKEQVRSARLVIIQLGGNDVTPGRKPDAIIRDMQRILRQLHAANPGVKVVISAVPVRWEWFVKNRPAEARRTGRLSAEENQRILDATNAWIAAGGDDAVRFGYFDVNRYIGFCSESAARRVGRTCEGNDDETSQRPEFRRARADVHLNLRGYDSVAGAIIERYLRVEQQET
jgi:lysophospholipase L1-like esterase